MAPALRMLPLSLLAASLAVPARAGEPPPWVQTHLDLEIRIDYEQKTLEGMARLTLRNTGVEPESRVPLQIGRLLRASAAFGARNDPIPFTQDVVVFDDWPTYQVNQVHLTLPAAIPPGEQLVVGLRYSGALVGYTESGMSYVQDHIDRDFTILRSESRAFPVVAVPSSAALRSAPRQDFTFDLRVTVPADLTVALGSPAVNRITLDSGTQWVFRAREPVPFLNVCIAPYRTLGSDVRLFYFPVDSIGASQVQSAIDGCLGLYAQWFGTLEGETSLHLMEIPEGWGSQASLTAGILQTADAFREGRERVQLYHELAHLWHPRDLDVPAPRWNEGLAMFLQQRVAVALDEAEPLDVFMQKQADRLVQQLRESEGLRSIPMIDYGKQDVTGFSYRTGRLFFHVLYSALGAEAFDRILGAWCQAYRAKGCTTEEFVAFVGSRSDFSLQSLFQEWLYTTQWATRLDAAEPLDRIIASYRPY